MLSPELLNKYTLKSFLKWIKLSPADIVGDDEEAIEILTEYLDSPLYSISKFVIFDELKAPIEDFINEMESKKQAAVTNMYINPITEKMEEYTLDYDGKNFIIFEPREENQKEFELNLTEDEFINYLIEKGENRFDAVDIVNNLKEESKIASLIKVAQQDARFFATVNLAAWVDLVTVESDEEIQNIKKENIPIEEKIKKAKDRLTYIVRTALTYTLKSDILHNIYGNNVEVEPDSKFDRINWEDLFKSEEVDTED